MNENERRVQEAFESLGWKLFHRGPPDFLGYLERTAKGTPMVSPLYAAIEVKCGTDRVNEFQKEWLEGLRFNGIDSIVFRGDALLEEQAKQFTDLVLRKANRKTVGFKGVALDGNDILRPSARLEKRLELEAEQRVRTIEADAKRIAIEAAKEHKEWELARAWEDLEKLRMEATKIPEETVKRMAPILLLNILQAQCEEIGNLETYLRRMTDMLKGRQTGKEMVEIPLSLLQRLVELHKWVRETRLHVERGICRRSYAEVIMGLSRVCGTNDIEGLSKTVRNSIQKLAPDEEEARRE